jgi:MerR family transcriptional regulator, light-induced transcriptional regulator
MKPVLSPKEVAAAVGVSESSLKRWADDGRINVYRTVGGHRRISLQEAVRFARAENLPVVRPEVLGLPEIGRIRDLNGESRADATELLGDALKGGRSEEARAIIVDLYLAGESVAHICDETVRRAMHDVGEIWKHAPEGIAIEHRATDICIQALNVLRHLIESPTPRDPSRGAGDDRVADVDQAIGGAPGGDPYLLPSLMLACVVADHGMNAINLGPNTPLETLELAARQHRPRLLWLSCSAEDAVPSRRDLDRLAATAAETGSELVVGGRFATATPAANHVHRFTSMSELAGFLRGRDRDAPREKSAGTEQA